jgi:very-short-patch-repair endonuclease
MKTKLTHEQFLIKAKLIHGDRYDYSKARVLLENGKLNKQIEIICPIHGSFFKTAGRHIVNGQGCQKCGRERSIAGSLKIFDFEKFLSDARAVHGDKYDYVKNDAVLYGGTSVKIPIICKEHGEFLQMGGKHLSGQGCPKCGGSAKLTLAMFKEKAKTVHDNRYDYSLITEYNGLRTHGTIRCPDHGEFKQILMSHLAGAGCARCRLSKGEILIVKALKELKIENYVCEKTFDGLINPETGKKLRFDFYLPDSNLLIEYDGECHFHPAYFNKNSSKENAIADLEKYKIRDNIKTEFAKSMAIKLLRISFRQKNSDIAHLIKEML